MNWVNYIFIEFDQDTITLLNITVDFLVQYFGYSEIEANKMLVVFLNEYGSKYDEDFFHHELSYRVAAIVHYLQGLKGDAARVGHWLIDHGYNDTPREAVEYFRECYFK